MPKSFERYLRWDLFILVVPYIVKEYIEKRREVGYLHYINRVDDMETLQKLWWFFILTDEKLIDLFEPLAVDDGPAFIDIMDIIFIKQKEESDIFNYNKNLSINDIDKSDALFFNSQDKITKEDIKEAIKILFSYKKWHGKGYNRKEISIFSLSREDLIDTSRNYICWEIAFINKKNIKISKNDIRAELGYISWTKAIKKDEEDRNKENSIDEHLVVSIPSV